MNLISIQDLSLRDIESILDSADSFVQGEHDTSCSTRVFATLFFQPSTRTRSSTEAAMHRLGAKIISTADRAQTRDEPLSDLLKSMEGYIDLAAIRHPAHDELVAMSTISTIPILNCGTGTTAHPTQTLADLYLIKKHFGSLSGVRILLLGDYTLRAARSLLEISEMVGLHIDVCCPEFDSIPLGSISKEVHRIDFKDVKHHLSAYDVVYLKPLARVDYLGETLAHTQTQLDNFLLLDYSDVATRMKRDSLVLHSLPRYGEMDRRIDTLPNAKYFELARYAMFVRMAVIQHMLFGQIGNRPD